MESPTKNICEKLENFHLGTGSGPKNTSKDGKQISKTHLHIPQLLPNDNFKGEDADESVIQNDWDEQNTVVYKMTEGDASIAEFMKVKFQMQAAANSKMRPKLINPLSESNQRSINTSALASKEDGAQNLFLEANETWEELKRSYDINNGDLYADENHDNVIEQSGTPISNSFDFNSDDLDKSAFSFQEMPKIKLSGSTLNTAKVTSFRSNYRDDSPLNPPKLVKPFLVEAKDPIEFKVPLKLITPTDLSMVFDERQKKWIKPQESKQHANQKVVQEEVTSITNSDISFSESKKSMISALTSIIKPESDWDKIDSIDLSNQRLMSLIGLSDFLPSLNILNAVNNRLTNFDGVPLETRELNLSQNIICDHLSNISCFKSLLTLDLSGNKITTMDSFKELYGLKKLNLAGNRIKKLVGLRYIETLDLSHNLLDGVLDFEPLEFSYLTDLNLSDNCLESLKGIGAVGLKKLLINNNHFDSELRFTDSEDLQWLELVGNSKKIILNLQDDLNLLKYLSFDGNITIIGNFPRLKELHIEREYDLKILKDGEDLHINPKLESLTVDNSGLAHDHLYMIIKKFPFLKKLDLRNNLVHGSFSYLVDFLTNYSSTLKVFNIDNNPLASYIKTDLQKKRYKEMILQIMRGNIDDEN